MQRLNEDMKQNTFQQYYILTGNDEFLINSFKKRLFDIISQGNGLNQAKFLGERADVDAFIDVANTLPFFSDAKCILVEDSMWFKTKKSEEDESDLVQKKSDVSRNDKLLDAFDRFPSSTHVIFVEKTIDKRSALYKKLAKLGYVATLNHPTREQLIDWALRRLTQNRKKITSGNMNLFLEYVGDDLERVGNELDKLIAYLGDKEVVMQEDIETITSINVENRIFDMVEDIAHGMTGRALRKYKDLMDLRISPYLVLNLIARQFNLIMLAKSLFERNLSNDDSAKRLGVRNFVVGKLISQGKGYSQERLKSILNEILDLERECKQGEMDVDNACILLIASAAQARNSR